MLRLVNTDVEPTPRSWRPGNAESRVASANRHAAALTPDDARWVFANQVRDSLEGGRAAILPPNRRRDLVAAALRQGLRPFDANLVIAIVQDEARTGRQNADRPPAGLSLVREPDSPVTGLTLAAVGGVIVVLAFAIAGMLIAWITG